MKTIKKNELYKNLGEFLRSRGIEFTEGSYTSRIRQTCALLTQAVNSAQRGLHTAKTEVDRKLDEVRQAIHEKTAPPPPATSAGPPASSPGPTPAAGSKPRKPGRARPAPPKVRKPIARSARAKAAG